MTGTSNSINFRSPKATPHLPKIKATLPSSLVIKPLFGQSLFVRASLQGVVREAGIAAVLTSLMILMFLGSWRSTMHCGSETMRVRRKGLDESSSVVVHPSAISLPAQEHQSPMIHHANGTFEVKLTPQQISSHAAELAGLGRSSIEKQFHGDLEGTSTGEMLTAVTKVKGSAGYVAIERVTGTLRDRTGSFFLQHSAVMTRCGTQQMVITVVPDSGTDQLAEISGTMTIKVENGVHLFAFEYAFADDNR